MTTQITYLKQPLNKGDVLPCVIMFQFYCSVILNRTWLLNVLVRNCRHDSSTLFTLCRTKKLESVIWLFLSYFDFVSGQMLLAWNNFRDEVSLTGWRIHSSSQGHHKPPATPVTSGLLSWKTYCLRTFLPVTVNDWKLQVLTTSMLDVKAITIYL